MTGRNISLKSTGPFVWEQSVKEISLAISQQEQLSSNINYITMGIH
jgi:hypothetical protein